jgi:hypothetical protein
MSTGKFQLRHPALALILAVVAGSGAIFGIVNELILTDSDRVLPVFLPLTSDNAIADRGYRKLLSGQVEGPGGAIEVFQQALRINVASPYRWCDLGEAYLAAKHPQNAYYCITQAVRLGPQIPPILMRASNVCLREGKLREAALYTSRILSLVPDYDNIIFSSYYRFGLDSHFVLNQALPADSRAFQSYFRYRLRQSQQTALQEAWAYGLPRGYWDDGIADDYARSLGQAKQYEAAAAVWADRMRTRDPDYPKSNRVFNGGFEFEPTGALFDWRLSPVEGAKIARDTASASGNWSLRVQFDGTENLSFAQVSQYVFVTPGDYRFQASIRTEGITTDQGVGLRISDSENPGPPLYETERFLGTHGWTKAEKTIQAGPKTKLLYVELVRSPSLRFDCKIAGTVWIDAVSLRPIAATR